MEMRINAATCDARKVQEETLQVYERITINAAEIITDERSRALLGKYRVVMNCAETLDVSADVRVRTVNGSTQIKSGDVPGEKSFLTVNGSLEIGPDCQKVLEQYVGIRVNGTVMYPESLSGVLGMMAVNGSTVCYPDGAVVLKGNTVIDRLFALRAKNTLYWSSKRLVMVDPALDVAVLAAKGARFSAKVAIIAESKVEAMAELLDERTDIVVVPDGTAVVRDNVELDERLTRKYGTKLYILGNITVKKGGAGALEKLEYLNIRGDAYVDKELKEEFQEKAQEINGKLYVLKGRYIRDKESFRVTKWLLEQEAEGISVEDCAMVKIDADVDKALILERLTLSDCACVSCTPEQEAAVGAVSTDCAQIGADVQDSEDTPQDKQRLTDVNIINAAEYVM